jgi:hypothetical protein
VLGPALERETLGDAGRLIDGEGRLTEGERLIEGLGRLAPPPENPPPPRPTRAAASPTVNNKMANVAQPIDMVVFMIQLLLGDFDVVDIRMLPRTPTWSPSRGIRTPTGFPLSGPRFPACARPSVGFQAIMCIPDDLAPLRSGTQSFTMAILIAQSPKTNG